MVFMPDFSIDIDAELEVFRQIKGRCFKDQEYQDRWDIVLSYLKQQKLDSLIIYGAERAGSAIPWLTGWPVTCLLYTSPSPRDLSTSRMPSSA